MSHPPEGCFALYTRTCKDASGILQDVQGRTGILHGCAIKDDMGMYRDVSGRIGMHGNV